ncbi:uncharacterized protein LOC135623924 isoform X1 [Musa acuminata AAA Group]|uniref:uncharacterized protein LOC135623924 isoform X1 n=1 Tax=Musa acuminata AAA Group TaxID=214697 RepID=UPI0031E32909
MWWDEEDDREAYAALEEEEEEGQEFYSPFGFLSLLSRPKDYYKILEVDYDATEEAIRSNFIRLALKWHPDKKRETMLLRDSKISMRHTRILSCVQLQRHFKCQRAQF